MNKYDFVIRASAGTHLGIGHLARCSHLARELQCRGQRVLLLLDNCSAALAPWLQGLNAIALYQSDAYRDEEDDASRCLLYLQGATAIVDDYRLGESWERKVSESCRRVMVIDDLANRSHYCDWLVDSKWLGVETATRYEGLLTKPCTLLLGPNYCLLGPEYSNASGGNGWHIYRPDNHRPLTIVLSLGGGGDLQILAGIIERFLQPAISDLFLLKPVIGPASINREAIDALAVSHDNVVPVSGAGNLYATFCEADLFLGAAGTALYELNCVGLPAITFALADNQQSPRQPLDELGHFFHLNREEFFDAEALVTLVLGLMPHWQRVHRLCTDTVVKVDGKGIARIADSLQGLVGEQGAVLPYQSVDQLPQLSIKAGYACEPRAGVMIRDVVDRDINHYLDSRNLPQNRRNMTEKQQIRRIDHYRWWFDNGRSSYALYRTDEGRDEEKMLYIWHQLKHFAGEDYLIGGWFVCSENCGFELAALALKWQLALCAEQHPGIPWVAVIDKQNRFVSLLNQQAGFVDIDPKQKAFAATREFFPYAEPEYFNFVGYGITA